MFENRSVHTATLQNTCRELAVEPPKPYLDSLADSERLIRKLNDLGGSDTAQRLTAAVFGALIADTDPLSDTEVQRLAALQQLQLNGIYPAAEQHRRQLVGEAITANADAFAALWSDAVVDDGKILSTTATLGTFSDVADLNAMHPSELVDPADHAAWVSAVRAERRLNSAAEGFLSLVTATQLRYPADLRVLALAPDLPLDALAAVNRDKGGQKPDAFALARHGVTPRLCGSLAAFADAVSRIGAEQAKRKAEADEHAKPKSFGESVGMTREGLDQVVAVRLSRR